MAVLILLLSCLPCADGACAAADCADTGMEAPHDEGSDEGEDCSPFCTCSCCGITIALPQQLLRPACMPLAQPRPCCPSATPTDTALLPVWQPPRTGSNCPA